MKARLTLRPGQKGTGKLTKLYGDHLYRIRYRYDEKTRKRFKTVELIAEETDWEPPPEPVVPDDPVVGIRVDYEEKDLQNIVRKAGGVWDRERKLWRVRYKKVPEADLTDRIVQTDFPERQ